MQVTIKVKLTKDEVSAFRSHFGEKATSADVKDALLAEIDAYFNDLEETAHERSLGKRLPIQRVTSQSKSSRVPGLSYEIGGITFSRTFVDVLKKHGHKTVYLDNVRTTVTELMDAQDPRDPDIRNQLADAIDTLDWDRPTGS